MRAIAHILKGSGARFGLLRSDARGNLALGFALFVPAVILLGVGAVDLLAVRGAETRLQSIADAGALAGAPALALPTDGATAKARAAALVRRSMSAWPKAPTVEASYEVVNHDGQPALHVSLKGNRPSFFANMLPPGGWNFSGDATATSGGLVPASRPADRRRRHQGP